MPTPTDGMKEEAQRGIDWREEFDRGGTEVGARRARQILRGENISESEIKEMHSFFLRHEVNKQAEGFSPGEEGYPSAGRIAWALWGGDPGQRWARNIVESLEENRAAPDELRVGDFVSWDSSGGRARGEIERIERDGSINVPDSDFTITGTPEDPAALIRLYRQGEATDRLVGHRFSTLTKINPIRGNKDKERHIIEITEDDDSIIIKYGKSEMYEGINVMPEEVQENTQEIEEERLVPSDLSHRAADMSADVIDEANRRVRIVVSTETPVERGFGMEVLDHSAESIRMDFFASGRAPLLLDHDMSQQIGKIESVELDQRGSRMLAVVRFGRGALADEVFRDVVDGIRSNISVGYRVNQMKKDERDKDGNLYRVTSWQPLEASVVSVPADVNAHVGRSTDSQTAIEDSAMTDEIRSEQVEEEVVDLTVEAEEAVLEVEETEAVEAEEIVDEIAEAETARAREDERIRALGKAYRAEAKAEEAIAEGKLADEFKSSVRSTFKYEPIKETEMSSEIGMTAKEVRNFSLVRALNALANPHDRRAQEAAAFEFDVSNSASRGDGFVVPFDVMKRDLNSSDDSALIGEDFRAGDFIEALRNQSSVMQAGATMLNGLVGDVKIPRQSGVAAASFISNEGNNAHESEMTANAVTMTAKHLAVSTEATKILLTQSSLDVENLIRNDLTRAIALGLDNAALQGDGTSGAPTGIRSTGGINTQDFAATNPTFAEIVAMETAVATDNALMGTLAYIMNATQYGALKTTEKATNTAQFVVEPGGTINGYPVIVSNQVAAGDVFFGNFADLLVGTFGSGVEIIVDPFTKSRAGNVVITASVLADVAVRHAVSFCLGDADIA
jgi:HK97 family phage major capsid protein/HK97 family phage prohead protease